MRGRLWGAAAAAGRAAPPACIDSSGPGPAASGGAAAETVRERLTPARVAPHRVTLTPLTRPTSRRPAGRWAQCGGKVAARRVRNSQAPALIVASKCRRSWRLAASTDLRGPCFEKRVLWLRYEAELDPAARLRLVYTGSRDGMTPRQHTHARPHHICPAPASFIAIWTAHYIGNVRRNPICVRCWKRGGWCPYSSPVRDQSLGWPCCGTWPQLLPSHGLLHTVP